MTDAWPVFEDGKPVYARFGMAGKHGVDWESPAWYEMRVQKNAKGEPAILTLKGREAWAEYNIAKGSSDVVELGPSTMLLMVEAYYCELIKTDGQIAAETTVEAVNKAQSYLESSLRSDALQVADNRYRNAEGDLVSLSTLCRQEPEWAANRIRTLIEELTRERTENFPRFIYQGSEQEITSLNVYRKALKDCVQALKDCVQAMIAWGNEEDGVPVDGVIGEAFSRAHEVLEKMPK